MERCLGCCELCALYAGVICVLGVNWAMCISSEMGLLCFPYDGCYR